MVLSAVPARSVKHRLTSSGQELSTPMRVPGQRFHSRFVLSLSRKGFVQRACPNEHEVIVATTCQPLFLGISLQTADLLAVSEETMHLIGLSPRVPKHYAHVFGARGELGSASRKRADPLQMARHRFDLLHLDYVVEVYIAVALADCQLRQGRVPAYGTHQEVVFQFAKLENPAVRRRPKVGALL